MYSKELSIPKEVNLELTENKIRISGPKGEMEKKLELTKEIKIEKVDDKVKAYSESEDRKTKALIGTNLAHIRNAVNGVTNGFTYQMKVVYSHFPVTVKVEGDKVLIQNFLGERKPRIAKIVGKTEVKIEGANVTISGINIEEVGQTAGNIERATRIVGYDKKVFQDGIYIVSKGD